MITELVFVLDRSGSMRSMRQAAINGFNEFLRDQQAAPGVVRLTLVLFDHETQRIHDSLPIAEVLPLDRERYVPRGATALLDAVGETIDGLGRVFDARAEAEKPGQVIFAILTDGEENSSTRYSWPMVSERIAHQREKYQWDFLFLGAGPDTIATASRMNIAADRVSRYAADGVGQQAASKGVSRKILALRSLKMGAMSKELHADLQTPLEELVRDEEDKRRE